MTISRACAESRLGRCARGRAAIAWSWYKAQGLSGERIGYLALPPDPPGIAQLRGACTIAHRKARSTSSPKRPIDDDVAFIGMLQREGILGVPGQGFGRAGYMRLSLTIPRAVIERSLAGF